MDKQENLTVALPMFVEVTSQRVLSEEDLDGVVIWEGEHAPAAGDLEVLYRIRLGALRSDTDLAGSLLVRGGQEDTSENQVHKLLIQSATNLITGTAAKLEEALQSMEHLAMRAEDVQAECKAQMAAANAKLAELEEALKNRSTEHAADASNA